MSSRSMLRSMGGAYDPSWTGLDASLSLYVTVQWVFAAVADQQMGT